MRPYLAVHIMTLFPVLFSISINSVGQANTTLSNLLSPTRVNQSLLPNATNVRDLGSTMTGWKNLYLTGNIYVDGERFIRGVNDNILLGNSTGVTLTTGNNNIAIGESSLNKTRDGISNIALGYQSLYENIRGNENIAIGMHSLGSNVNGDHNIAIGKYTLYNHTTSFQIAIGYRALMSNTTGSQNIGIGFEALFRNGIGLSNTAIGYQAMYNNTSGGNNTAFGTSSLFSNTGGLSNVATGDRALYSNTTGNTNSAFGGRSLYFNATGSNNAAFGYNALSNNTQSFNSAFGVSALISNTSGTGNTGVGYSALNTVTTHINNTAIGHLAGASRTVNSGTLVGARAQTNANGYLNVVVIGADAIGTASNQVRIGNTTMTSIGGYRAWSNLSDGRFKKNVKDNVPGIEFVMSLRPVTYTLDMDALDKTLVPNDISDPEPRHKKDPSINAGLSKIVHTGFVAQEVEEAARKLDFEFSGVDAPKNESDLYSLRYSEFVVPLVKAMQEVVQKNNDLEERIIELEKLLSDKKIPGRGSIAQNSPNPFTSTTVIRYTLPDDITNARIELTNVKGQLIKTFNLPDKGTGQLQIMKGALAAGTYYYTLWVNGEKTNTKKMIIVK